MRSTYFWFHSKIYLLHVIYLSNKLMFKIEKLYCMDYTLLLDCTSISRKFKWYNIEIIYII